MKSAVITRNSDKSTSYVLKKLGVSFEQVITRDSDVAVKPDPAPLLMLAKEWGIETGEILMVGDFLYDVICGKAAGTKTCLVTNELTIENTGDPDYLVGRPGEVIKILEELLR